MDKVSGKLTVFFEEPFWVGVFERVSDGKLSVCKVTFGAEPKDYEVYDFVLKNYYRLRFSSAVATVVKEAGRNPKRVQREVRKQVQLIVERLKALEQAERANKRPKCAFEMSR